MSAAKVVAQRGEDFIQVIDVARRVKGEAKKPVGRTKKKDQELQDVGDQLINAVVYADIITIRELFEAHSDLTNVVYTEDMAGRTPLQLAVDAGNIEIVNMILDKYNQDDATDRILVKRVLMVAISRDQEMVSEAIVQQERYDQLFPRADRRRKRRSAVIDIVNLSNSIMDNVAPIVLAAQRNQFGLVQILLKRGDRIEPPHPPSCQCDSCKEVFEKDQLMSAKLRLENYKGLASNAYVSLAAKDPINEAFKLGKELREVASIEKHYKKEYLQLAVQLSEYVYLLMDEVKTDEELNKILNRAEGEDDEDKPQLARIKQAVEYGEKHFVAHPSCQHKLMETWYSELRSISNSHWRLALIFVAYLLFAPIIYICYVLSPKSKLGRITSTPFVRFVSSLVWFTYFLVVVILMAYHAYLSDISTRYKKEANSKTSPLYQFFQNTSFPTDKGTREESSERIVLASITLCWVVGMVWAQVKRIYKLGYRSYISDVFNVMESLVILLYLMAIALMFDTQRNVLEKQRLIISEWPYDTQYDKSSIYQALAKEYWYWVIPDRHYWENGDPGLVVDALFAAASILTVSKIFYYMHASSVLGPLVVAFRHILTEMMRFFAFLLIILLAFMMALQNLFSSYSVTNRKRTETLSPNQTNPVSATANFGTFSDCISSMFWAMFAVGEPSATELEDGANPYKQMVFTARVAQIIFGLYHFVMIVVMLNFFIAIMNETFFAIMLSNDREWKFARAKLYVEFLTGGTQPSPLNWIPTLKAWFYCCTCKYTRKGYIAPRICWEVCYATNPRQVHPGTEEETQVEKIAKTNNVLADASSDTYQGVIYNLVKRFLQRRRVEVAEELSGTEELKNDIVGLRQALEIRILENKDMAKEAKEVARGQDISLTALDVRIQKVEKELKEFIPVLKRFMKILTSFKDVKDEMAKANINLDDTELFEAEKDRPPEEEPEEIDEEAEAEKARKDRQKKRIRDAMAGKNDKTDEKPNTMAAGGAWAAASLVGPDEKRRRSQAVLPDVPGLAKGPRLSIDAKGTGDLPPVTAPAIDDTEEPTDAENVDVQDHEGFATPPSTEVPHDEPGSQEDTTGSTSAEDPDDVPDSQEAEVPHDEPDSQEAEVPHDEPASQEAEVPHDEPDSQEAGVPHDEPDSQEDTTGSTSSEVPHDDRLDEPEADMPGGTASPRQSVDIIPAMSYTREDARDIRAPPAPSQPGDIISDIDEFLASEEAKDQIAGEPLPDYSLPDDDVEVPPHAGDT